MRRVKGVAAAVLLVEGVVGEQRRRVAGLDLFRLALVAQHLLVEVLVGLVRARVERSCHPR